MRPREVHPGRTYMITRRCAQRQLILTPDDPRVAQGFLYCLAEAAQRFGIVVLWTTLMSDHHHTGVYDPLGVYPAFLAHFHKMVAKVINSLRHRSENLWSSHQTNVVRLLEPPDVLDKMGYSIGNPAEADLVERAIQWPGACSYSAQLRGATLRIRRPHWFFASDGKMPEEVELRFGRPPGFEHLSEEAWVEKVREAVTERERRAAERRAATSRRVLGRKAVRRQSWRAHARSEERRGGLAPRLASKSRWRRIEALRRNRQFLERYRAAFEARRAGDETALFPLGTYQLRVLGLVRVAPA